MMFYFDYCATTPIDDRVLSLMTEVNQRIYGNPSSIHQFGQEAHNTIETARHQVANAIHCQPGEIIFTSGGTEANNMVLWNVLYSEKKHIVFSSIEHPSITKTIQRLEALGVTSTRVPVDSYGIVHPEEVRDAIREDTGLVTVMMVNNEIGTIEPISDIGELCEELGIFFHSDGVQALGKMDMNASELPITAMSFSAHKLYGPKGVGALYLKDGHSVKSLVLGGSQEHRLRAGTENVSGIAGFGLAAEIASEMIQSEWERLTQLETYFLNTIRERHLKFVRNGHPKQHVPGVINITFPDVLGEDLLINLDMAGFAVSTGSACASGTTQPSSVLKALGIPDDLNRRTLRISFGRFTRKSDIDKLITSLSQYITQLTKITDHSLQSV